MADWSVKIVQTKGGAAFQPDLQGYNPGEALPAQQDDLVTWNNTTKEAHQPWQTDANYQPLSDQWVKDHPDLYMSDSIPAGRSSRPSYDTAPPNNYQGNQPPPSWTVHYFCKLHPDRKSERGTINVEQVPTS